MRGAFTSAKWRVTCPCIKITWRFIQLGISLWQIGDMVSDAFLTEKFYRLAMVSKTSTILQYFEIQHLTMLTNQQCTREAKESNFSAEITADCTGSKDTPRPDVVNWAYFVCSMCVWFVMPMLSLGNGWSTVGKYINQFRPRSEVIITYWSESRTLRPFFYLGKLILAYTCSIFFVYIVIPGRDMYLAMNNLFCHARFLDTPHLVFAHRAMPAYKLFEQIGEAVPQFCIAVIFYALNWHWLSEWDQVMGIVTMTLSMGSINMGLVKGCMFLCCKSNGHFRHFNDWTEFFRADFGYGLWLPRL